MRKLLYIQMALIMSFVCAKGQNREISEKSCKFEQAREEQYRKDPNARKQAEEFEKVVAKMVKSKIAQAKKAGESYVVPVVFHVYGTDFSTVGGVKRIVTDDIVKQALKEVNDNFKGFNDAVDSKFAGIEGGMNVTFKLAQIDPNGNTTTGIVYHEYKLGFGLDSESDNEIAKYAWDNYKYFNVHIQLNIYSTQSSNDSGIAWRPSTSMSDEGTARVVYNGRYLIYTPPASSLTHEFGHYLGLAHTFEGGCVEGNDKGDLVADTPPTIEVDGACNLNGQNCFNNFINVQNHMDYNPCESMFTKGQVARMESFITHPARVTLWQDSNLTATGVKNTLGPRVVFNFQERLDSDFYKFLTFIEDYDNNGKILNRRKIKAVDGAKFAKLGILTLNTDFKVENVPSGLTPRINVINDTTAEIYFEGSAANHAATNSGTLKVILLNPAIVGGIAAIFSSAATYKYQFSDPYTTVYENIYPDNMMAYGETNFSNPYVSKIKSSIIASNLVVGLQNFDGDKIVINNADSKFEVLCETGTNNVKYFAVNEQISNSSTGLWKLRDCVTCPQPVVSSPDYKTWYGKTGYIAIRVPTLNASYAYGWVKATVTADGQVVTLSSIGLNYRFGQPITASIPLAHLSYSSGRFLEAGVNNGAIGNEITMTLSGTTFAKTGVLTSGIHYDFTNVPAGFNAIVTVINSTTARIKLEGVATNNLWSFNNNLDFKLLNAAVTSGNVSTILFSSNKFAIEYIGNVIRETSTAIVDLNKSETGGDIYPLDSSTAIDGRSASFKFFEYKDNKLPNFGVKYITYRKDAIADANFNLTPLDEGAVIGSNSAWKRGRETSTETGQHTIDSPNYNVWRGKTKYAGIRIRRSGRIFYGWTKIRVSADGKTFEHLEYALNNIPDKEILAGKTPVQVVTPPPPLTAYCSGTAKQEGFFITNVKLGTINNSTSTVSTNGYSDFTNQIVNVTIGSSQTVSVTSNYNNATVPNHYNVWIDWNQNKSFEVDEKVLSKNTGITVTNNFTVPTTAKTGNTRMRVRYSFDNAFDACGFDDRFGEVEDYTINVTGTTPVTGNALPTPGGIFASSISATGFLARYDRPVAPTVIEVQILEGGSWITLGTATINNFRINKRGSALNYKFRVRAVKGTETSNWSAPFDVVLPAARIGLDQVGLEEQFKIYPIPATNEIFFSFPEGTNDDKVIEMYDMSGRQVDKLINAKSYNVNKLPKGIYQVRLITTEYVVNKPIIVQ
jgi:hypothetical protein